MASAAPEPRHGFPTDTALLGQAFRRRVAKKQQVNLCDSGLLRFLRRGRRRYSDCLWTGPAQLRERSKSFGFIAGGPRDEGRGRFRKNSGV